MYVLRRWWERYGTLTFLVALSVGAAFAFKQTDGAILFELYQRLSRPFQGDPSRQNELVNAHVTELQHRLVEVERENQRLKDLLSYKTQSTGEPIFAPVVGRSSDRWWQHAILGRGRQDGIRESYVVMASGGLVGRVISVTENTSRILLVSDASSRVGVTVSRSRAMGVLRGKGSNHAVMEFFEKLPDVREGDAIATSTYSPRFPSKVPLGTVVSVNLNASPAPQAEIELSVPLGSLEWVAIYPNPSKPLPDESAEPIQGDSDAETNLME
ncbi:MAG: rod shape-determining protein MreC [Cyanobacteria bacterium SID2]|nr:rod shape-determining protein MreC [Cyanobacteria bacterium SID2]MBP0003148.1 rod shape-determining protein MreC [Cyanobacteria bacterium SBC]